jgi:hypothetical protein
MKIIDRYVGSSVVATAFFGVVVLSLVLVLGNLFKELLDVIINNFEPEGVLADSIAWFRATKDLKKAERWERFVFADRDARGGSHYFGFGDVNGDGWGDISVGAKGGPFEDGNWFAFWTNPGAEGVTPTVLESLLKSFGVAEG